MIFYVKAFERYHLTYIHTYRQLERIDRNYKARGTPLRGCSTIAINTLVLVVITQTENTSF